MGFAPQGRPGETLRLFPALLPGVECVFAADIDRNARDFKVTRACNRRYSALGAYTYAKAGVSIAAGNALVKAIAPLAKATARPGADAESAALAGFST
jgi:hypothetical protein